MGRRLRRAAQVGLAAVLLGGALHVAGNGARFFVATKNGELTAEAVGGAAWCNPEVTLIVRAREDRFFTTGETNENGQQGLFLLNKLISATRLGLQAECPQTTSVTLNGFVDDVFIYRGYASRDNPAGEWVLLDLPVVLVAAPSPLPQQVTAPLPVAEPPPPPRLAAIGECDALAAHPDDPKRPKGIAGVADDDIKPGPALKACEEAVAVDGDDPRLQFQLARALISYDKAAEGLEKMIEAAEAGHGAAVASLGDITLYGLLDETPDPATAKALYLKAAKLGFKPAAALAAAIESNPQEDTSGQQQIAEPQYHKPDWLAVMFRGEALPGGGGSFMATLAYSARVVAGIVHHCPQNGIQDVTPQQMIGAVFKRAGPGAGFFGLIAAANEGYAEIQQMGLDDGYALAVTSGCDAPQVLAAVKTVRETLR